MSETQPREPADKRVVMQLARVRHMGHGSLFDLADVQAEAHELGLMALWRWMEDLKTEGLTPPFDAEACTQYGAALEESTHWTVDNDGRVEPADTPDIYGMDR